MASKIFSLSMILELLFLSNMMTSFSSTEASISSNGQTGRVFDETGYVVLKEDIFTPMNDTASKDKDSSTKSGALVKKATIVQDSKSGKDPSLFICPNISLKVGEYEINENMTLYVKAFRMTLNSSFYIMNGKTVTVCKPVKKDDKEVTLLGKVLLAILTFAYSLITLLSAMCSFSKNSTYLKLALVSWICVSSNIFLWTIIILIIPGTESVFSWVSMSVNMNQSIYLTSAWMALLTCNRSLVFLQKYSFIEISKRTVTVKVGSLAILCIIFATTIATINFVLDQVAFAKNDAFVECLFCNPLVYVFICLLVILEAFLAPFQKDLSEVSRSYRGYHYSLSTFSLFNFFCIAVGTAAVMYEWHLLLWLYTVFNFTWPLFFVKNIIARIQTLIAVASDNDDDDDKIPITVSGYTPLKKTGDLEM